MCFFFWSIEMARKMRYDPWECVSSVEPVISVADVLFFCSVRCRSSSVDSPISSGVVLLLLFISITFGVLLRRVSFVFIYYEFIIH